MMDANTLEDIICQLMPSLSEGVIQQVSQELIATGVERDEDLQYIKEGDLVPILRPIQARKLIEKWKPRGKNICYRIHYAYCS